MRTSIVFFLLLISSDICGQKQQDLWDMISTDTRNYQLENLLMGSLDPDKEIYNSSLLCNASYKGAIRNVETLIKYKANVNYSDKSGNTPLRNAIRAYFDYPSSQPYRDNLIEIMNLLSDAGAKADQLSTPITGKNYPQFANKTSSGMNITLPRFLANIDQEKMSTMIDFGQALYSAATGTGQKTITAGSQNSSSSATEVKFLPFINFIRSWDETMINTLIRIGADPMVKDEAGNSAFRLLLENNKEKQVDMLYASNPGIVISNFSEIVFAEMNELAAKIVDSVKNMDLYRSSEVMDPAASLLIKYDPVLFSKLIKKIDPKRKDSSGKTLLHYASQYGHLEEVKYLIKAGINPEEKDKIGATPFFYSVGGRGNLETVKYLYSLKPDINIRVESLMTPLMYSIYNYGETGIIFYLLENGADVNQKDNNGYTALHIGARRGLLRLYEALIKKGADINAKDNRLRTPLHYAASGMKNMPPDLINVEFLVENGADINAKDEKGLTPAAYSRYMLGNNEIVKYLNSLK